MKGKLVDTQSLTEYEKRCRAACPYCAAGIPLKNGTHCHRGGYSACCAPTKDEVIADLALEVDRLRKAAIDFVNISPQQGDMALMMLSMTEQSLSADNQKYIEDYASARQKLRAALTAGK